MTDSDSPVDSDAVPATTFLPDHLVGGTPTGATVPVPEAGEAADDGDADASESGDATAEFCRSWRSHLSGSRSRF